MNLCILKHTLVFIFFSCSIKAATFTSNNSGDWNTPSTWIVSGGTDLDGIPDADDDVVIARDDNVTLALASSLTINSLSMTAWSGSSLSVTSSNSAFTFNITNNLTYSSNGTTLTLSSNVNLSASSIITNSSGTLNTTSSTNITIADEIRMNASNIDFNIEGNLTANSLRFTNGMTSDFLVDEFASVTISDSIYMTSGPNSITVYGSLNTPRANFDGGTNSLDIFTDGEVNITNGVTISGSAGLDVGNSGTLLITNDVELSGGASLSVDGNMEVDGNVTMTNGIGTVNVDGSLSVSQTLDIADNNITGSGSISANPLVCSAGTGSACSSQTGSVALPIELIYFIANFDKNKVTIKWQTATEEKNDYFTIERSKDGINFEAIATVQGAGYSYTPLNYSYTDKKALQGVSYYRLTQTDYDGAFETFNSVSVSFINKDELKIGPNPASNFINVSMGGEMGDKNTITIYNITGAVFKTIEVQNSFIQLNIEDLPAGTYMMLLNAGETNISKRIIVE